MKNTKSIFSLTMEGLQELLEKEGLAKFGANQIFTWIYKHYKFDTSSWSNVSNKTKEFLNFNYNFNLPKIIWDGLSSDGTRKFLVKFDDEESVEVVAISAKNNRVTLCISSQVGCAIGCTFCHTGTMGLKRNLTTGEIVGQYLSIQNWLNKLDKKEIITNIVFMGQGEPLHNFDNVKDATINFLSPNGIGLGQRKITLSTSGLVPQIEKLGEFPPVNIAISLHAAHDTVRSELMPINKTYDLSRLFKAIKSIPLKAHRWITYEYILIKEFNDTAEDIKALCELLDKKESKINLIPFNEYPESKFKRPSNNRIMWFKDQLIENGFICTIRTSKGNDILAACGQLKSKMENNKLNLWE